VCVFAKQFSVFSVLFEHSVRIFQQQPLRRNQKPSDVKTLKLNPFQARKHGNTQMPFLVT